MTSRTWLTRSSTVGGGVKSGFYDDQSIVLRWGTGVVFVMDGVFMFGYTSGFCGWGTWGGYCDGRSVGGWGIRMGFLVDGVLVRGAQSWVL